MGANAYAFYVAIHTIYGVDGETQGQGGLLRFKGHSGKTIHHRAVKKAKSRRDDNVSAFFNSLTIQIPRYYKGKLPITTMAANTFGANYWKTDGYEVIQKAQYGNMIRNCALVVIPSTITTIKCNIPAQKIIIFRSPENPKMPTLTGAGSVASVSTIEVYGYLEEVGDTWGGKTLTKSPSGYYKTTIKGNGKKIKKLYYPKGWNAEKQSDGSIIFTSTQTPSSRTGYYNGKAGVFNATNLTGTLIAEDEDGKHVACRIALRKKGDGYSST